MIRVVVVVAAMLFSPPAQAIPCWVVRKAVAQYGETAAESWARSKGFSDKEIEKSPAMPQVILALASMV